MKTTQALVDQRVKLIKEARGLVDVAEKADRDLTSEEEDRFDRMMNDSDSLAEKIERRSKVEKAEEWAGASNGRRTEIRTENATGGNGIERTTAADRADARERKAYGFRSEEGYRDAFGEYLRRGVETRDLEVGTAGEGGYLTETTTDRRLVVALQSQNFMRAGATVIPTSSDKEIPVEATAGVAAWGTEEGTEGEDDTVAYGQATLGSHKLVRILKVSEELVADAVFDLEAHLADQFARVFAIAEETAMVSGDGSGKPTGIMVTGTAAVTAAAVAAVTGDELMDCFYALRRPYRARATWIMNDSTVKTIRKMKELSSGGLQYLWQPGLKDGEPDTLLGRPIAPSDGAAAMEASAVSIGVGDLSYYWLADRIGSRAMRRLDELYIASGQYGFRMINRVDGKLTLAESFQKITMAAS